MNNKTRNDREIVAGPVGAEQAKMRLDKWLASATELSRSRVSALIEQGAVFLKEAPVTDQDRKTAAGEIYHIILPPPVDAMPQAQEIPLEILYEDKDLLVLNKSAGMVVHPAAGNYEGTLVNALLAHCRNSLSGIGGVVRPGIVHRLDKETSGLMVVAKNDAAHQGLSAQFAVHSLERCYLALVWGMVSPTTGVIETQIGRSPANRKKMAVVSSGGKRAETHYRLIESYAAGALSLVHCSLKTGRTHQVRVHMTALGHPLIGDKVYGRTPKTAQRSALLKAAAEFPRQALHSYRIRFEHPITHETMRFEIPLPADMQRIIDSFK
ncbi:MAG: RluA family pseudouridine synthase [Alphaproteobacteria bacterium]|nr:RluA family pseudouridine synthase [Alphaproteobacteria bacterium]